MDKGLRVKLNIVKQVNFELDKGLNERFGGESIQNKGSVRVEPLFIGILELGLRVMSDLSLSTSIVEK